MIIHQKGDGKQKLSDICGALGVDEMLGQFCEECAEAIQAAQKVRRSMKGTTPVSKDDALVNLTEECADVALLIDCLIELGLVYRTGVQFIGRYKTDRWYRREVLEKMRPNPMMSKIKVKIDEQILSIVGPRISNPGRNGMESECKSCKWWRPIDGYTKSETVCLFCYLNGHSRAREEGKCFEYKRRRGRARKQVP